MGAINIPTNWQLLYDSGVLSRSAQAVDGQLKIPDFLSPVIGAEKIISVLCEGGTARPWWRYAGRLSIQIRVPATDADFSTILQTELKNLNKQPVLIQVPQLDSDYYLRMEFPYWLDLLNVRILEYIGPLIGLPVYTP